MQRPARRAKALGLVFGVVALSCSEKPPSLLVWARVPSNALPPRAALAAVAARSAHEAVAVGNVLPEHSLLFQPVGLSFDGVRWNPEIIPGHGGESARLTSAALAFDAAVWVCGTAWSNSDDPASATPLVYRRAVGVWEPVDLMGVGETAGINLAGITCTGGATDFEIRAVGTSSDATGVCFRFRNGAWDRIDPPPPTANAFAWGLAAVGCSPYGIWYAAGWNAGTQGGAVFEDRGSGWQALSGPARSELQFAAVAFDAPGNAWFVANDASGVVQDGLLLAYRGGQFETITIERRTAGPLRLFALGFDTQGYGWVGGGRPPDEPFLAGNSGGSTWKEVRVDTDAGHEDRGGAVSGEGGEIMGLSVVSKSAAIAVGQVEEYGPEGYLEQLPRIFHLLSVAPGDPDAPLTP